MENHMLASLPADPGRRLTWIPLDSDGQQQILLGAPKNESRGPVLGVLRRTSSGDRVGSLGAASVGVRVSGRAHLRVRLVAEPRGVDLASFTPDWAGLGPLELADGSRYLWRGGLGRPGGAVIRDSAGEVCLQIQCEGPEENPTGRIFAHRALPPGHTSALATLGWCLALREQGQSTSGWGAARHPHEEWPSPDEKSA